MKKDDWPLVTVAIPTFNRLGLLKRAIASVLAQDYKNLEIIISDNASIDGTNEYLRSIKDDRVNIFLGKQNLGMVSNWDHCLAGATGYYFLLMSDDDAFSDSHAIEKLVSGFMGDASENVGAVFSDVWLERVDKDMVEATFSDKTLYSSDEIITDFFLSKVSIFPCVTLFRTKDLRDFGGYSSFGAKLAVDACAWIVLALKYGEIRRFGEPLAIYRVHQSLSSSSVDILSADFDVMQKLVEKYKENVSLKSFVKIKAAMHDSWSRYPIGYIIRQYRDNPKYGALSIINDLIKFRKRVFSLVNVYFIINRIFRIPRT